MNALFSILFLLSVSVLIATRPDTVLSAITAGGEKALALAAKMTVTYAVWLGVTEIAKSCGLFDKLSSLFRRPLSFLLGKTEKESGECISANLSANALGMGGVATPMGKRAIQLLETEPNGWYKQCMLFVLNATSIQLLPTSVLTLRASLGSLSAGDIVLPSLIATALSTLVGIFLVRLLVRRKNAT